jgi:xylulokinase
MPENGYLLGYDIGSSSVKATLLEVDTGNVKASAFSPETELEITSQEPGWAEQNPAVWWEHLVRATALVREKSGINLKEVLAIGISYQMHGLVIVDKNYNVLRPAIIWCDSRAVEIGDEAFQSLGEENCLKRFLNSPGNFTASKLKWVMIHELELYKRAYKMMLPGDYIALKLTGEIFTTPSGLSEGVLWDFQENTTADSILRYYNISPDLLPQIIPTFHNQGQITHKAAEELSLRPGTFVSYRAGDQPNNAFSLSVLHPGEIAATAGTSGVIYGILDSPRYDARSRVNTFLHVNHTQKAPRYGALLCVNGAGILNSWLKRNIVTFGSDTLTYTQMNKLAELIPAGSEGLVIIPYGNGAERTLENKTVGASICNLDFNIHTKAHILRAGQEGIVFAMKYGLEIMSAMGIEVRDVRAGNANMFLSPLFCEAFATVTGATVTLFNTDGSQGAARGAGVGAGLYSSFDEAFIGLKSAKVIEPNLKRREAYLETYLEWHRYLKALPGMNESGNLNL